MRGKNVVHIRRFFGLLPLKYGERIVRERNILCLVGPIKKEREEFAKVIKTICNGRKKTELKKEYQLHD